MRANRRFGERRAKLLRMRLNYPTLSKRKNLPLAEMTIYRQSRAIWREFRELTLTLHPRPGREKSMILCIPDVLTPAQTADFRRLLEEADGGVKTAVVMHRLDVTREDAEQRLARAGGRLGDVIDGSSGASR